MGAGFVQNYIAQQQVPANVIAAERQQNDAQERETLPKKDAGGYALAFSNEARSLLSTGNDQVANEALDAFLQENGIEESAEMPFETQEITEEMRLAQQQESKQNSMEMGIAWDVRDLMDGFKGGDLIGKLPLAAIQTMFEKRVVRFAKQLAAYVNEFGPNRDFYQKTKAYLDERNPNGDNATAQLILDLMDKIYAGEDVGSVGALRDTAATAFGRTFGEEIEASRNADDERRTKFQKQHDATLDRLNKQKEVLQDKIKKLQEELRAARVSGAPQLQSSSQAKALETELNKLWEQLTKLNEQIRNASGMPAEGDWEDAGILDW